MSNRAASATGAAWAPPLVTPSFAPCVAASVSPPNVSEIKLVFSIPPERPIPNIPPSWNVAPTDPLPVVRYDARTGERRLGLLRGGVAPSGNDQGRLRHRCGVTLRSPETWVS